MLLRTIILSLLLSSNFAFAQTTVSAAGAGTNLSAAGTGSSGTGSGQAPAAAVVVAGNTNPIVINDNAAAALYPSIATISGVTASITRVRVQLTGLTHTFPDDLDIILEGPQGQRAMLMSDAGGGTDVSGINLTFDPTAATVLPDTSPPALTTATFRPANYGFDSTVFTDTFPAPFPALNVLDDAPADLNVFNLTNPNGQWKLYVVDDAAGDFGSIAG